MHFHTMYNILLTLLGIRLLLEVILRTSKRLRSNVKCMIVLGSGGHTAEMLKLLQKFNLSIYNPRCYIVAETDTMSSQKATSFEESSSTSSSSSSSITSTQSQPFYTIKMIPRSREVGQSFTSSIPTTLRALCHALFIVFAYRPDLILINGPGTSLPIVLGGFIVRCLGWSMTKIVYVESIARVTRLSLTGKILYKFRLTDEFIVQWEELREKYPRSRFAGRLM